MRKLTWQEVRIIWAVAIVIFGIGVVIGIIIADMTPKAAAAAVDAHDKIVSVDRSLIEGGAMPCHTLKTAPKMGETNVAEDVVEEHRYYSVNGKTLPYALQDYLYDQLKSRGVEYLFQVSLLQIYQESSYNATAQNKNGLDFGLCQFRITYWDGFAQAAGLVQYDIWNPIDQIYVYAWLMAKYVAEEGTVNGALSRYFTGIHGSYCDAYVRDVLRWSNTIQEVIE